MLKRRVTAETCCSIFATCARVFVCSGVSTKITRNGRNNQIERSLCIDVGNTGLFGRHFSNLLSLVVVFAAKTGEKERTIMMPGSRVVRAHCEIQGHGR